MSTILDFSPEENSFFTGDYRDQVPGITAEFPSPKVFRVGSYSGSECDRQFQSFPTPPDSPVLAELTSAGNRERQHQRLQQQGNLRVGAVSVQNTFSHQHPGGYIPGDNTSLNDAQNSHTMDMELALLESLLYSNGTSTPMEHIIDPMPYSDLPAYGADAFSKPDGVGCLSTEFPLNLAAHGCFTDNIDDYNSSPVPSPSPINVKEIFSGDLPNLDDLSLVNAFAQMESEPTVRYGSSSAGEESDIESDTSYALPIDDMQPFNFDPMPSQMTSVMTAPPPLYHSHHHNIHPHTHYHHHQQQQQQQQHQPSPYRQQPYTATTSTSDRTHNYQCRTLHTTLKMLDANTDGIITEEAMPQQRNSCAGPIRKPYRSRPRKQSVTSSDEGCSDEEQAVTTTMGSTVSDRTTPNRNRGRGRREAMKGNHLWEFIRDLLKSESYCPKFIRWEDRESGVFRFVNSEAVANMWGRKKNNPQMTYEKLSRAMRYYYKREILERVDGRRLVYKFGKNADGWREAAGLQ